MAPKLKSLPVLFMTAFLLLPSLGCAQSQGDPFRFEAISSLDSMTQFLRSQFHLGSERGELRRTFVGEGHATLKVRAGEAGTEKYLYDIDLCHYYVWRWNISADFDASGKLQQLYLNGNPVLDGGRPKKIVPKVAEAGKKASIYRAQRARPEAYKGEKSLGFLLFDRDSDPTTTDDQAVAGAGPSRADPVDMGRMVAYTDVDPWRSIFDSDPADAIVPFQGSCSAADALYDKQKRDLQASGPR